MSVENQIKELLSQKFEAKRVASAVKYFLSSINEFEQGDWESSLGKAGKFVEAVVKLLWVYAENLYRQSKKILGPEYTLKRLLIKLILQQFPKTEYDYKYREQVYLFTT